MTVVVVVKYNIITNHLGVVDRTMISLNLEIIIAEIKDRSSKTCVRTMNLSIE
jgi:hypothetical protein